MITVSKDEAQKVAGLLIELLEREVERLEEIISDPSHYRGEVRKAKCDLKYFSKIIMQLRAIYKGESFSKTNKDKVR